MSIASINPTTGKLIKSYSPLASKELGHKLEKAWNTFHEYRHTSIADRGFLMRRAAELLDEEKESFGRLMTAEMGKTFRAAIEECQKSAWACRYFAESAGCWLADDVVDTGLSSCLVRTWMSLRQSL